MLVLPTLHTYLSQLVSPPSIHTALLLTPEGALVSYATSHGLGEAPSSPSSTKSSESSEQGSKPGSVASTETRAEPVSPRSKDEIRMAAGLSAEVWAETRGEGEGEGMVESELGRMLVVAVEDDKLEGDPLLLLAVNGTMAADWDAMRVKARKLAAFLAPSVNKHRGAMASVAGKGVRTRSAATSPGRGLNR